MSSPAPVEQARDFSEDEILILEVRFGKYLLSDGMLGLLHRGGVMLPLGEICRMVEFPIDVEPGDGRAYGWYLAENRLFSLNHSRSEVVVEGRIKTYDPSLVRVGIDDIYVDATLLSGWFPLDFELDLPRLILKLTSREPLPFERRLEREKLRASRRGARSLPSYPRSASDFKLLDWPFIDCNPTLGYGRREIQGREMDYNGLVSGDILFMTSQLFLSGNDMTPLEEVRLSLSRVDPDGGLLGPLRVRSITLGDIFSPQHPLIANSRAGRGIEISNFPVGRPSEFDRTTLHGELLPDWEVELYRNEILLDFKLSREDGRYEFTDVPLLFGMNVLRLVFYGPQGQLYNETRRIQIGSGMLRPGERLYRFAANQQDEDLFRAAGDTLRQTLEGEERILAEYEQGVSQRFSLSIGGASLPLRSGRLKYTSVGVRAAVLGSFTRIDFSRDNRGGAALQLATQSNPLGLDMFIEHEQFFGLVSERIPESGDRLESRTRVRLDGQIPSWILPRISLGGTAKLERRESGRYRLDGSNRVSMFVSGMTISNSISGTLSGGGGTETATRANSSFLLSLRHKKLLLRGRLNYLPPPGWRLMDVYLTGDYRFTQGFSLRMAVDRPLLDDRETRYTAGINRRTHELSLGLAASYQSTDNFALRLTMSFSLGLRPRSKRLLLQSRRLGTAGAVSARIFLDQNLNGYFDSTDKLLEGVRLLRDGRRSYVRSDAHGIAFITDLPGYTPTSISVDVASLADPFWVSTCEGVEIVPRPGKSSLVEFPIVMTGEVNGTVNLLHGTTTRGVSNAGVELVNSQGKVVQTAKTAFDGFYLFTLIPPGRYTVRISPAQLDRLGIETPEAQIVEISWDRPIASNVDFTIIRHQE